MSSRVRMIDANFNRAREALRTLEDIARFQFDDASMTEAFKSLRHRLTQAVQLIVDASARAAWRDTSGDVGTHISTASEESRTSLHEIASAASSRLSESLRVIEECAKLETEADAPQQIERIRYDAYDAAAKLTLATAPFSKSFAGWRLCVIISESACRDGDWRRAATEASEAGADCLQLREKSLDDCTLLKRARELVRIGRDLGAAVIINDRPDIALIAGATGVHVGPEDLDVASIRKLGGNDLIIGVSTKSIDQAMDARMAGANYCGVGAMFATNTKPGTKVSGPAYLHAYLEQDPTLPPALAIGGIEPSNIEQLLAGAKRPFGVAVCSCVCGVESPGDVCCDLLERMRPAERV